jgi:hypothetical protein
MDPTKVRGRSLWFPLLAPPAVWALQEWLGWWVGETTCSELAPPAVRWFVLAVSIAALLTALWGMSRAWGAWRATDPQGLLETEAHDRVVFMAFTGFLVSSIFSLAIIWAGLSSAFLGDCGRMR